MSTEVNTETPPYDVIERKNGYEIRRYHAQIWAQCTYEVPLNTDFTSGREYGFSPLFGYISGNNNAHMKIAMTVPVITQETIMDRSIRRKMSFIMSPSNFKSLNQLPMTSDRSVRLFEQSNLPPLACIAFNMTTTTVRNAAKEQELRQAATRDGILLSPNESDVMYLTYNRPDTMPQYRRNEICIPIIGRR
ncbi:hypothetical protein I4U23_022272 [Adineta vaga]|nr:hypothetical protein I4U23_022272 [Adineta vaga]